MSLLVFRFYFTKLILVINVYYKWGNTGFIEEQGLINTLTKLIYSNIYKPGAENVRPCMSLKCIKHKNTLAESHMVPQCNQNKYNPIIIYCITKNHMVKHTICIVLSLKHLYSSLVP